MSSPHVIAVRRVRRVCHVRCKRHVRRVRLLGRVPCFRRVSRVRHLFAVCSPRARRVFGTFDMFGMSGVFSAIDMFVVFGVFDLMGATKRVRSAFAVASPRVRHVFAACSPLRCVFAVCSPGLACSARSTYLTCSPFLGVFQRVRRVFAVCSRCVRRVFLACLLRLALSSYSACPVRSTYPASTTC